MARSAYRWAVVASLAASLAGPWGAAPVRAEDLRWPTPYLSSSAAFRDLVAPSPMPAPKLRPPSDYRGLDLPNYSFTRFTEHVRSVPLELALIAATYAAIGEFNWKWGDSGFHWVKEGYFGKNTHNGGMDKLGHAWTSFLLTELLAERMQANTNGLSGAHLSAAIIAFGVMAAVEVGDAYTKRFGFSRQDLVADGVGVAFALLRGAFPKLRETLDFRVTAKFGADANPLPPGVGVKSRIPAYNRQRYVLAVKGSGFDALKRTPARYLELQFAYDTQGFHDVERRIGRKPRRNFYVGLGLNLSELLFAEGPVANFSRYRDTELVWATEHMLRYFQVPYTAAHARMR